MGRKSSHRISKPHPSVRYADKITMLNFRRGPEDDIWGASFWLEGKWTPKDGVSLGTRNWDEAIEIARDKYAVAMEGHRITVPRAAPTPTKPAVPERAFGLYAQAAVDKLRQEAIEADAIVPGKGHNFRTLANRIENDLLPRWGNVAVTAITEHMLNDWIADDYRVEDADATVALHGRQPRDADRKIVWKKPSQTTLGNLDWALLHVWQEAVAAKVVDRRQRPIIDKSLGLDGEPRAFIDADGVQAVAGVMSDAWVAAANAHSVAMKRMLRCYVAMIACTGIRAGLEAKRVLIGNVRFLTQHNKPVILIRVIKHQGKHREPRSVIVYEGDPAFDVRKLLIDHIAWRRSQGAANTDYLFAWPDGSFPVFRDVLNTVLTEAKALIDPMTKEKRVAYSFRHYFATKLIELGLSVAQIAEWLGTSSAMVEKHYIQFLIERNAHLLNGGTVHWHQQIAAMAYPSELWETDRDVELEATGIPH
jgi:integrase